MIGEFSAQFYCLYFTSTCAFHFFNKFGFLNASGAEIMISLMLLNFVKMFAYFLSRYIEAFIYYNIHIYSYELNHLLIIFQLTDRQNKDCSD